MCSAISVKIISLPREQKHHFSSEFRMTIITLLAAFYFVTEELGTSSPLGLIKRPLTNSSITLKASDIILAYVISHNVFSKLSGIDGYSAFDDCIVTASFFIHIALPF